MPSLSKSLLFFVFFIICICSSSIQANSDSSTIKLPSDGDSDDLCPRSPPVSCPVTCFRPDPVCGIDGATYWCGCADAICSGTTVVKLGFCEVGNGGNGIVPGQALLLVHIVWLIVLGFSVLFGFF